MEARVAGLYRCDGRGRSRAVNQWHGGEPPRFHLARTAAGCVCRVRHDVADDVADALLQLARAEPPLDDPRVPPANQARYRDLLAAGGAVAATSSGPVYWFEREPPLRGTTLPVGPENAHLLRRGLEEWMPDALRRQPLVVSMEDGRAVSVCASVRVTAHAHEAGVETLPAYRGRGHAAAASAGWAREVARAQPAGSGDRGVMLFYSTSWHNVSSQRVAARLTLTAIGADFSIT